jgi:Zinc carboxypeptidase
MTRIQGLFLVTLICMAIALPAAADQILRVYPNSPDDLTWIAQQRGSIEEVDPATGTLRIYAPHSLPSKLTKRGLSYDVLIPDVRSYAGQVRPETPRTVAATPVLLDHYLDHAEMTQFLADLETAHPSIMSVEVVANISGYDMYLVKISDNVETDEDEPELFFEGQIHGDEIAGYMLSLHTIEHLLTNYDTDPDITALVDGREIFWLPATNSHGAFGDPRTRYNANGVDMNRDSGYMWHAYGGSQEPFGEAETQLLYSIWASHNFVFHTSWHSGTLAMSLPWSYHADSPPDWDEFDHLGEKYCQDNLMINDWFQGSQGMYTMHGSTKDVAYGAFGALGWTIELTNIKQCPWITTETAINQNLPGVLWLIGEAGDGLSGTITDSAKGDPVAAVIDIDGQWVGYNDPENGDLHRYLRPGTYDMTIWANGYSPVFLDDMVVIDGSSTDISTALIADDSFGIWAMKWLYNFGSNDRTSHFQSHEALGPPNGEFYSIGFGELDDDKADLIAHVVLDLGPGGIPDRPGDDLYVYEAGSDGAETIEVYGADDPITDNWILLGQGTGDCSFDIGAAGFSTLRYVKIVDTSPAIERNQAAEMDGYDLDAVGQPGVGADDDDDDDNDDTSADDDDDNDDNDDTSGDDDDDDDDSYIDGDPPTGSSGDDEEPIGGCCG